MPDMHGICIITSDIRCFSGLRDTYVFGLAYVLCADCVPSASMFLHVSVKRYDLELAIQRPISVKPNTTTRCIFCYDGALKKKLSTLFTSVSVSKKAIK